MKAPNKTVRLSTFHFCILFILFGVAVYAKSISEMKNAPGFFDSPFIELSYNTGELSLEEGLTFLLFFEEGGESSMMMEKNLSELQAGKGSGGHYYKINGIQHPEISRNHSICGFPTVIIYKNGKETNRILGVTSYSNLKHIYTRLTK